MLKFIRFLTIWGGTIVTALLLSVLSRALANNSTGWLSGSNLTLKQLAVAAPPSSLNGNIDCIPDGAAGCVVATSYGTATSGAEASLNDSSEYRPVFSNIDGRQHFLAVPNSSTFITYTTDAVYGLHLYFNYNFTGSITASSPVTGPQYQINRSPDAVLSDRDGHLLPADYSSMSFSQNGEWMIVSILNIVVVRVNLETFEVTPFAPGFNYTIGLDPGVKTSISNDGRYAVVVSKSFDRFGIYDLDSCSPTPTTISGPANCQYRDLEAFMIQQLQGFISASNIRFIDKDTMSFYATQVVNSSPTTAKFLLSDNGSAMNQLEYLALGDSYISGEGAFDYQTGTDTDDNSCHLSLISYPLLLGRDLNFDSYHSIACSGAVTDDVIDTSSGYRGQNKSKVPREGLSDTQIENIKSNFQPGYIDQLDFVSDYQPAISTLSIGGNDMGFSDILQACIEPWRANTCYSSYEDRLELVRMIDNQVFPKLVQTYQKIKVQGPPDMRLYVIGYPQIAKPGGNCASNVHLNAEEVLFSQQLVGYLDTIVKAAASRSGVGYVDMQNALVGHRLCEAGPGSVAMNGLTSGKDAPGITSGPIGNESYHPNALGHELLENAILAGTHNLTDPMPAANSQAAPPAEAGLEILNAPNSGRAVNTTEYDSGISADMLYKQSVNSVTIYGPDHSLAPAINLHAEIHSDPVSLGDYATDDQGNLSAQIVIPDSLPAGYHSLHFYGTDIDGQPIDIYKIVYIADSPDDMDGDGIPDSAEACVGVPPSGEDLDQDGIDDSCDGTIAVAASIPAAISKNDPTSSANGNVVTKSNSRMMANPKVLSAQVSKQRQIPSNQLTTVGSTQLPNSKILIVAGGLCIWITICYAAYKFRS